MAADGTYNVLDSRADPTGAADSTVAFQTSINLASAAGGGTVIVPPGIYSFSGVLTLPPYVAMKGTEPGTTEVTDFANGATAQAAILSLSNASSPFISSSGHTTLEDLVFYYPNQPTGNSTPIVYAPTIQATSGYNNFRRLYLPNPYDGIWIGPNAGNTCGRDVLRDIKMGVVGSIGIFIDHTFDVSHIENVHIWPFFGAGTNLARYVYDNVYGILVGRADNLMIRDTFVFECKAGLTLTDSGDASIPAEFRGSYGQGTNLSFDTCQQGGLVAYSSQPASGWMFTNLLIAGSSQDPNGSHPVTAINLSPGGVTGGNPPQILVAGGNIYGDYDAYASKGSASDVLKLVGVFENSTLSAYGADG
jgi:hypothetical protein